MEENKDTYNAEVLIFCDECAKVEQAYTAIFTLKATSIDEAVAIAKDKGWKHVVFPANCTVTVGNLDKVTG